MRNYLAFTYWPDTTETNARNNFRQLLFELRHALPNADQFLAADVVSVQWRATSPFTLDVADFQNALIEAQLATRKNDRAHQHRALTRAIELYRGDLFPNCYDEWIVSERERLRQEFIAALETLVEFQEHQRNYRDAIVSAQRLLQHDPLHESTYRHLMRLYASSGDRASALRTFHACTTILQRELAVEPSTETRTEYERLLKLDAQPPQSPPILPGSSPLVGRQREWAQLQAAWRDAANGRPQMMVLQGEAGIGKTRLAEELIVWAHRQSIANASAHCYAAESAPPFAPLIAWLRALTVPQLDDVWMAEIARLLPELASAHPEWRAAPLTEEWQRQRLFEAIARALLASAQPLLLLLDDLQWCDRDTLACMRYLLRFDADARLLIVGTCRDDEVDSAHPLTTLFLALRQSEELTTLELGALDERETLTLASNALGREIEPWLATQLYRETEGNPLFVVEVARGWSSGSRALPPKVQAAIDSRLAYLTTPTRDLADVAAIIGRDFAFDILAKASDVNEDTLVRGLDELWRRRIVREHGALAYDFTHDKLREAIVASQSAVRSRVLHRRVAEALEAIHANDIDSVSAEIATHYERARAREKAIHYLTMAADRARATYSNAEAVNLYRLAIEQVNQARGETTQPHAWRGPSASLREYLGEVLVLTGHSVEARTVFQEALEFADEPLVKARLYRRVGMTWIPQREPQDALTEYANAEVALGHEQETIDWKREWLEVQNERMWAGYWLGDFHLMQATAEKAEPVLVQYGTPLQRAHFFRNLVVTAYRRERFVVSDETLAYAREAVAASEESGIQSEISLSTFTLGFSQMWRCEWDTAEKYLQDSLKLAERIEDVERRVLALTYLTMVYRARRQMKKFQEYLVRARQAAIGAEMVMYVATAEMEETWLAWRKGNYGAALDKGYAALADLSKLHVHFPAEWFARLPLLAIHSTQKEEARAVENARAMLAPTQGRFSPALENTLQDAVNAWDASDADATRRHLNRAVELAEETGYL